MAQDFPKKPEESAIVDGGEISLEPGDVEIGAVEIKDATTNTRAVVGADGLHVDVQNAPIAYDVGNDRLKADIQGPAKTNLQNISDKMDNLSEDEFPLDGIITLLNATANVENNQSTIASDDTEQRLQATDSPYTNRGFVLTALPTNGDPIWLGKTGVTNANGFPLYPGESVLVNLYSPYYLYAYGKQDDKLAWIGIH